MPNYCFEFKMVGEVADMLCLQQPEEKLLIDISPDLPGHEASAYKKYPNRATVTVFSQKMIASFLKDVGVGDVIEISGTFSQGNYIPHRTTSIDTTFVAESFTVLEKPRATGKVLMAEFAGRTLQSIQ